MDEIVKQALAKWPNVPHCTGWLLLDRRGQWRMRDDATQAAVSRISKSSSARDKALMAAANWLRKECATARLNNSSLLANDKYSP